MAWAPVFSPDGELAAAKVEINGKYRIAVNGRLLDLAFSEAWDPVFSPGGDKLLVKGIGTDEDVGKYCRHILETDNLSRT
jgi:hypothetical protein